MTSTLMPVVPADMAAWAIVTANGIAYYLVDESLRTTPSERSTGEIVYGPFAAMLDFPRAYRLVEQTGPALRPSVDRAGKPTGDTVLVGWKADRFCFPTGLWLSPRVTVSLLVTERISFADAEEIDLAQLASLVNAADALRKEIRASASGLDLSAAKPLLVAEPKRR